METVQAMTGARPMKIPPNPLLTLVLILVAPFSAISAQAPDAPAAITGETAWISYADGKRGLLTFDAAINGHPAHAVTDTGVTFTSLDRTFAERFWPDSPSSNGVTLSAAGGAAVAELGPLVDIALPAADPVKRRALVADHSGLAGAGGRSIDMLLGMDVIGRGALELDLAHGRWRFAPSGGSWPRALSAPLRYTADRYHNYIVIDVEGRPLRLGIDTGYDGGLMLTAGAAAKAGLLRTGRVTTIAAQGLGGVTVTRLMIPKRLRVGTETLADMDVRIDDGDGLPTQWGFDGLVGLGFLRRFHVALDYPAGTMRYALADRAPAPPVRSTIGVQAGPDGAGLAIVHVMANSPAARAGWKAGERICAVEGAAIDNSRPQSGPNPWNVAKAGTRVAFQFCDGTARTLIARDFY